MRLRFISVEHAVAHAHKLLLEDRRSLRESGFRDPVDWLEPSILAEKLGLEYELVPTVPIAEHRGGDTPVGLLDLVRKHVLVSEQRGPEVARFTGAHEIGHYLYHQGKLKKHWERVVDPSRPRPPREREADLFASLFLMPERLLRRRIDASFGTSPLRITDNERFHLCPNLIDLDPSALDLEYALATASRDFSGCHIVPLHRQFKVSVQAMAIQLHQLEVLLYPATSCQTDL